MPEFKELVKNLYARVVEGNIQNMALLENVLSPTSEFLYLLVQINKLNLANELLIYINEISQRRFLPDSIKNELSLLFKR